MISKMTEKVDWYRAFGLIHEKDNHIIAVFAYKLATGNIETALEVDRVTRDTKQ